MEPIKPKFYKDWIKETREPYETKINIEILTGNTRPLIIINGKMWVLTVGEAFYTYKYKTLGDVKISMTNNSVYQIAIGTELISKGTTHTEVGTSLNIQFVNPPDGRPTFVYIQTERPTFNGGLSEIDFGDIAYDKDDICEVFDRFYRNWFINNPYDEDFREILQECYDLNKEKISRFYTHTVNLRTTAYTTMTVDYDKRKLKENAYDYPLTGNVEDSSPSGANVSEEDAKSDTTTVEKDEDPIKTVNDIETLRTFNMMFIDCFKPCFTLFEAMMW